MEHPHRGGSDRRYVQPVDLAERHHGGHGHRHQGHRSGGRRGSRPFGYGELRLLVLAMIGEQPTHGYDIMKAIEERMNGSYSPSPGVIYPTLAWLEDIGYAVVDTGEVGRKQYRITAEGEAFLAANRMAVEALAARMGTGAGGPPEGAPMPVLHSMENLKAALRQRLKAGPLDVAAAASIAAAIDAAAQFVERGQ